MGKSSPCNSFNGGYSWSNAANEGVIFWSGSVGYVCLIVCSVFAPILLLVDAFFLRKIRMGELSNSNETQYNALSTDDSLMESKIILWTVLTVHQHFQLLVIIMNNLIIFLVL